MAGLTTATKNAMLDTFASQASFVSLHSADPGTTGTSELTGGSPAYARKPPTWNAASGSAVTNSNQLVFDVPAGSSAAYAGYWSLATGGVFRGSRPLSATENFTAQGTHTIAAGGLVENLT